MRAVVEESATPAGTSDRAAWQLVGKRLLDVVVGGVLLVLATPLVLLLGAAIKLCSAGPVVYRQVRLGQGGREFTMFKLRTMHEGAEQLVPLLRQHNEMDGPVFKMRSDPRVFPLGRLLRRMSLDELPQLWNVINGDMSLVGPRPPLPSEVRKYEPWQLRRLAVRPGITGPWQVRGRNETRFVDWMRMDVEYVDSWSLRGDLVILLRTLPAVLMRRGAM